jgi:hypothetical protein
MPAKYFLNKAGVDYCLRRRVPVRDLHDIAGERSVGFEWQRCRPDAIEQLVGGNMLSHIEIYRSDFISARPHIIAMTQSILDGILISRFRGRVMRSMVSSPRIADAIRSPSAAAAFTNKASISSALAAASERLRPLLSSTNALCASSALSFDDPEEGKRNCAELVSSMTDDALLVLAIGGEEAAQLVAGTVATYARRMSLASQLSLFLMEFIQIAEKSYFQSMAEHDRYVRAHPDELPRLLAEPSFRDRLIEIASRRGEAMVLRASFASLPDERGSPQCLEIAVKTKGLIGYDAEMRERGKKGKSVKRTDMSSLLKRVARDDEYADLSLAYYAGLEDACNREGMSLASSVSLDEMKNETVATMRIVV